MIGLSGIILAGGRSRRMGTDKALIQFGGRSLIAHVVDALAALSDDLIVVTNTPERFVSLRTRLTRDVFPGKGVLGGIYSGLLAAQHSYSLVVGCDMPFLNVALLRRMADLASGCDALVPWLGSGPAPAPGVVAKAQEMHPLHAIYATTCLPPIAAALAREDLRVIAFFRDVRICYLLPHEIDRIDPGRHSLMNLNTPDDLATALQMLRGAG